MSCAELFVAHNGYTDLKPSGDSTQWVREMLDGSPLASTIAGRRNSLQQKAAVVCTDLGLGPVYLVGFRRGSAPGSTDRWVMMDKQFQFMKIGHQPTDVDALLRERSCVRAPSDRNR